MPPSKSSCGLLVAQLCDLHPMTGSCMAIKESLYLFVDDHLAGAVQAGGERMEGEIWSRLPEDLLVAVLMRLPFMSHLRFMAVCKKWRCLLSDLRSLAENGSTDVSPPCFCGFGFESGLADGEFVLRLPQSSLRPHRFDLSFLPVDHLDLWAADKGLLCFSKQKHSYGEACLGICNPLSRRWRDLPTLRFDQFEVLHRAFLQVDTSSHQYEIVLLAKTLAGSCFVFVYNSRVSRWKRLEWRSAGACTNCEPVLCRGVIHALRLLPSEKILDSFSIRKEREVAMANPPPALFRKLLEQDGSLYLVSFLELFSGISIWKLDEEKSAWEHVSACPSKHYTKLKGCCKLPVLTKVAGLGGFICLCIERINNSAMSQHTLAYDTRRQTWCAWDFGIADPRRRMLLPFQPRLASLV